ncbi:putative nucleic-acid-binding protein [Phyllobacterium sp. 1468]|uniref:hypothetical protein n=1 Tax=Phyllobacterium sp. 1468 TaxID=2817759 RepID=UPI0028668197|nr:hypothetical protein [Phyllobacterium sp. 1468]MDR6633713.1 putative nucleic-acid-binding protein [Phyllobacterium sp. 1468]
MVIRYLAQDDRQQSAKATQLMENLSSEIPGFLIERSCDNAKCSYTATFDATAAKTAGVRLID